MGSSKFESLGVVFVYIFKDGRIYGYKGELKHLLEDELLGRRIKERMIVDRFTTDGKPLKYLNVANNEGEIFNNILWLRESDSMRAAQLFIDNELLKIAELRDDMERCGARIEMLEKFMEGE